jgi:thiol-disulfide isomerase/thioredoxin
MRTNLLIAVIALMALLAGAGVRQLLTQTGMSTVVDTRVNVYEHPPLRDLQGDPATLEPWKGKRLLINFWASWCEPCREEMPLLSDLQQQSGTQSLTVIGLALDDPEEVRAFLEETPVAYPVLLGGDNVMPWMKLLGNQAAVLPFSVLTNDQGKIVSTFTGKLDRHTVETWGQ